MDQTYRLLPYPQTAHQTDVSSPEGSIVRSCGSRPSLDEQFNRSPPGYDAHSRQEPEPINRGPDQVARESDNRGPQISQGAWSAALPKDPSTAKPVYWNGLPWYRFIGDSISIILSICFLALGVSIVNLQGQNETQWSRTVVQATQLAASLWPVIFSGILGNALRVYANWRLQKGERLLLLEQLLGSLTMASTILSAYFLSALNLWTLYLVFLWAFNPLGSQASLRSVHLVDQVTIQNGSVRYGNSVRTFLGIGWDEMKPWNEIAYLTALASMDAPTQSCNGTCAGFEDLVGRLGGPGGAAVRAAMDPWGSPRVPKLRRTPGYDRDDPERWLAVPWNESVQEYSSLVGARYYNLDPKFVGNVTFAMGDNYIDVSNWTCVGPLKNKSYSDPVQYDMTEDMTEWFSTHYKSFDEGYNVILDKAPYDAALTSFLTEETFSTTTKKMRRYQATFAMDYNRIKGTAGESTSKIFLGIKGNPDYPGCNQACVTSCAVQTIHVDTEVLCMAQGITAQSRCGVHRIRQMSQSDLQRYGRARFDLELVSPAVASYFLKYFGKVGGGEGTATFSERFMQDPSAAFVRHDKPYINLCNISMELFEDRLGLILNTFLDSTWGPQGVLGAGVLNPNLLWNATSTMESPLPAIYALDVPWIATYFAATAVMTLAALGSLVMRCHLVTPPVLGSVGGLAKDSPYFAHLRPAGSSTEGGEDVSKRLRRARVGMVDVQAGGDVGRMALAPVEMGEKVRKGRRYE